MERRRNVMKYPMLNEWILFDHIDKSGHLIFKDYLHKDEYIMSYTIGLFAMQLNGKRNPYFIKIEGKRLSKRDVRNMMKKLEQWGLIRHHRYMKLDDKLRIFTIWIPQKKIFTKKVATAIRLLLQTIWLPAFMVGLWILIKCFGLDLLNNLNLADMLMWGCIGTILHEMAHFLTAISFGRNARVFELGLGIDGLVPFAYNLTDLNRCSKIQYIIIAASGPAMDLTMFGIHMLLATRYGFSFCYSAAFESLIASIENLIPFFKSTDGSAILEKIREV